MTNRNNISRHLVHPETLPSLDARIAAVPSEWNERSVADYRAVLSRSTFPLRTGVSCVEQHIPGRAGSPDCRMLVLRPGSIAADAPCFFFIHGGGYVVGCPELLLDWGSRFAAELNCVVVLPSYRLAPEARWPSPIEDLYAQLSWVSTHAFDLGIDPARIAVGGVSAGGGHAAGLVLKARNIDVPAIHFQVLMCPMLDDRLPRNRFAGEFVWTRQAHRFGWDALLGMTTGGEGVPVEAVPNRIDDLSKLPPTYITVGDLDLFAESCLEFSQRLMAAGVPTELHVYPGGIHGFELMAPDSSIAKWSLDGVSRALRFAFERTRGV